MENCYSAVKFSGQGTNYSITSSLVHNYASVGNGGYRDAGYCFNYVFDNDLDGNAKYYYGSNLFDKDQVQAKKTSTEMQQQKTYTDKGFSAAIWDFSTGYPTLYSEV